MVELAEIALWVSVAGGIAGLAAFLIKLTDRQTAKHQQMTNAQTQYLKELIDSRANTLQSGICKDIHELKEEIGDVKQDLKDVKERNEEIIDEFRKTQTDVAVLTQVTDQLRKSVDVHTAEIGRLEER